MKFAKKYNIHDEIDARLFKLFLRIIKDNKKFVRAVRCKKSFKNIIKICYDLRASHNEEPIFLNASYWPDDIGVCPSDIVSDLFLYVRMINAFKDTSAPHELKELLMCEARTILTNNQFYYRETSMPPNYYKDDLYNAMLIAGVSKRIAKKYTNQIMFVLNAKMQNIPF